jgi:hypothetical protein
VTDFGITHLAGGQSDVQTTRTQFCGGILGIKPVMEWSARQKGSISIRQRASATARVNAPTVPNDQHDRPAHRAQSADSNGGNKRFFR